MLGADYTSSDTHTDTFMHPPLQGPTLHNTALALTDGGMKTGRKESTALSHFCPIRRCSWFIG